MISNHKLISILFFLLISFSSQAQLSKEDKRSIKKNTRLGDETFSKLQYNDAARFYAKVVALAPDDVDVQYKLAESYRITRHYSQAKPHYKLVSENANKKYPLAKFWLAKMYKIEGNYDLADNLFKEFKENYQESDPYLSLANNEIQGNKIARDLSESPRIIDIFYAGHDVNEDQRDDFAAIQDSNGTLYFTGVDMVKGVDLDDPDSIFVNRIYTSKKVDNTFQKRELFEVTPVDDPGNHIGNPAFSKNGERIYYTVCEDDRTYGRICEIQYSDLKKGEWSKPKRIGKINTINYSTKHPVLVSYPQDSNEYLIFSSDIDGSVGGYDLWYSVVDDKGRFSSPVNLGKEVNTLWDEGSPFYDVSTATLYFSSNGHWGVGEFDIFGINGDLKNNTWEKVINLGLPINSSADDYYLNISTDRKTIFLTSNRASQNNGQQTCCDNIYFTPYTDNVINLKDNTLLLTIMGKLTTPTNKPLEKAKVSLVDMHGEIIENTFTDNNGKFKFKDLSKADDYSVRIEDIEEDFNADILITDYTRKILKKTIKASPTAYKFVELPEERNGIFLLDFNNPKLKAEKGKVSIYGKIKDKNEPIDAVSNVKVFLEKDDQVVDSTTTDEEGKFDFKNLPENNDDYLVKLDDHIQSLMAEMMMVDDEGITIKSAKTEEETGDISSFKGVPLMQSSIALLAKHDSAMLELVNISGIVLLENMDVAKVYLLNSNNVIIDSTGTDILGRYEFNDLPPNENYSVKIDKVGANTYADVYLTDKNNNILKKGYQYNDEDFKFSDLNTAINSVALIDIDNPDLFEFKGEAEIIGRVVDAEYPAFGVKGLDVYLFDAPENRIDSTKTNAKGEFKFENLVEGKDYFVEVQEPNKDDYLDRLDEYIDNLFTEMLLVNNDKEIVASSSSKDIETGEMHSFKALPKNYKTKHLALSKAEVGAKFTLNNILFETGKYNLLSESYIELDKLVKQLRDNSDITIEIAGHTDNVGSEKDNLVLSEKRAKAVQSYLIKKDIDKTRLFTKGYSSSQPLRGNDSEFGRSQNRRVEITIKERN